VTLPETLALLNACFNATAGVFLLSAYVAVRQKRVKRHQRLMVGALVMSALFLTSYLTRYALAGDTPFRGEGWLRPVYFTILISHVMLAVTVVPLVLRTVYLAAKRRFVEHRRIARWTFPIWAYVSVTGVVVYLMLYQLPVAG
jgi:putative membrane protein